MTPASFLSSFLLVGGKQRIKADPAFLWSQEQPCPLLWSKAWGGHWWQLARSRWSTRTPHTALRSHPGFQEDISHSRMAPWSYWPWSQEELPVCQFGWLYGTKHFQRNSQQHPRCTCSFTDNPPRDNWWKGDYKERNKEKKGERKILIRFLIKHVETKKKRL